MKLHEKTIHIANHTQTAQVLNACCIHVVLNLSLAAWFASISIRSPYYVVLKTMYVASNLIFKPCMCRSQAGTLGFLNLLLCGCQYVCLCLVCVRATEAINSYSRKVKPE